jgi:selenophosphate synthetase-related protein
MLAECSGVGIDIDIDALVVPNAASLDRWLTTFPSYGYLLSASPATAPTIIELFASRDISATVIGDVTTGSQVAVCSEGHRVVIWDHTVKPLLGLQRVGVA